MITRMDLKEDTIQFFADVLGLLGVFLILLQFIKQRISTSVKLVKGNGGIHG